MQELDNRFSTQQIAANKRAEKMQEPAKTLLIDNQSLANVVKQAEETAASAKLDIATLKPGDVIEGRYKFIEKIGKGAFGTVLLMEDTVVEERLILKFLNPNVSSDEEMMKRFVHELRYSRKITHKNVIRIYDFLYIRGNYAISMEYFPSHTLGGEIVNEKPVALKRAVKFGIDIATGMAVAHQAGIVHRDLKPANVLIDNDSLLKIVDFGVAAAQSQGDTQLTKTGYVIGSPKYMAPEQILGKKVDERADIYSLGVIMYEMFAGVPPYSRGDHMSVMYQHVQGKARQPIEINKDSAVGTQQSGHEVHVAGQGKTVPNHGRTAPGAREIPLDALTYLTFMGESRPKHSKNQLLTGSLTRYGKSRRVPQVGSGPGLLGPASCGRGAAHAAHAWGPDAHQIPQSGRCRTRGLHHRNPDPIAAQGPARGQRSGLLLRID